MVKEFPRLSNEYRNGMTPDTQTMKIKEKVSIYASNSIKWIFYFLSAGFLVLILAKIFNPNSETTWSSLGVIGSGLLFYGVML